MHNPATDSSDHRLEIYPENALQRIGGHSNVGEIRGKGLLVGVELVVDRESRQPLDEAAVGRIVAQCMREGVIVGRNGNTVPGRCNVLVLAPPLVLERGDADRIVGAVGSALDVGAQ